jgi:[ribosomal protein S18]-alanine N-acetyltransferase
MPYLLENMTQPDIPQVAAIERLSFSLPWPTSAYRRELKTPDSNRYIVARYVPPHVAARLGLPEPTANNLTSSYHPQLASLNGNAPGAQMHSEQPARSILHTLMPWLRNNGTNDEASPFPVIGYAGLWLMVDEAHITTIAVHPDHRGQGVGELLFLGLIDIAREMKAQRLTLEVRVSNTSAQALYRKYGMEIAGMRRRYYSDNGEDAYIMWSEPINAPAFRERVNTLRGQLAERLQQTFHSDKSPSRTVDRTRLQ